MYKILNWKLMLVQVLCVTCIIFMSVENYTPTQEYCESYLQCPPVVIEPQPTPGQLTVSPIVIDLTHPNQPAEKPPIGIESRPGQPTVPPIIIDERHSNQQPGFEVPDPNQPVESTTKS